MEFLALLLLLVLQGAAAGNPRPKGSMGIPASQAPHRRLVHALKGNSLPATLVELVVGEATFAVKGRRSQVMHRVWVRLDSKTLSSQPAAARPSFRKGRAGRCLRPVIVDNGYDHKGHECATCAGLKAAWD